MKPRSFGAIFLAAVLIGEARSQDTAAAAAATTTLRVYLLDRHQPSMLLEDAAASLTLRYRSGRGRTILLSRIGPSAGNDPGIGMIRGIVGSPGALELFWKGAPLPTSPKTSLDPERSKGAMETLRRAHQGPFFAAEVPASLLEKVESAWITIRQGAMSWTSEEFRGPEATAESEPSVLAEIETTLQALREGGSGQRWSYMDLHPRSLALSRELSKLATAGFLDDTQRIERERQWCLALARAIQDSCGYGDWGRVSSLALQAQPRVRNLRSLQQEADRPTVPNADPR